MKKWKFKPIGSSVHTTKYLAFGKALLATLYLKVKVHIYKCIYLDFYVSEDSLDLENLTLLNIEWTLVLQFGFLDVLKLYFFTRCLYFHHNWRKQRGTNIKDVTKEKKLEIHKHSWLSIIKLIFFKLGFTPCKAEQPLRGMELQEKKHKKDYRIQKICLERTYS